MITWDPIAPGEDLISAINWAPRLGSDAVASNGSTWSAVSPAGPIAHDPAVSADNLTTYIWIKNCTIDTVYSITNTIITVSGQTEIETALFTCAQK